MAEAEYHVASFVVSTKPEHVDQVTEHINSMPGLEVHAEESGKLVVTAEAEDVRVLADVMTALQQVDSIIAVAPVYHEYAGAEQ